jgi:flagellar biosynthetic protein FliP
MQMRNLAVFLLLVIVIPDAAMSQDFGALGLPTLTGTTSNDGSIQYSLSLQVLALMTAITVIPSLILGMTSFTRIIIVLSILRQALGTQQTPPNQVLVAIALFLSFYVMSPVLSEIYQISMDPYLRGVVEADEAILRASSIVHDFLIINTRSETIRMFADLRGIQDFASPEEVPFSILLPSFITSELKTAFQIGFLLFLPFLVIDMVIASVLMSLGMMMLSPMLISLPFKLLLFVLVDGWAMTIGSLASTFQV